MHGFRLSGSTPRVFLVDHGSGVIDHHWGLFEVSANWSAHCTSHHLELFDLEASWSYTRHNIKKGNENTVNDSSSCIDRKYKNNDACKTK